MSVNLSELKNNQNRSKPAAPANQLATYFEKHKDQIAAALPKHLNADRMARLALTLFSQNAKLRDCDPKTIFASVIVASQLGLELGVLGQAYLVPYKTVCTCIPGWQGYVDLVSRAGRATVWTGAVYEGDEFDYSLGDSPFIRHRPCGEDDLSKLLFVYAVGRVNKAEWPIIEVWPMKKVFKHRNKYNKVGQAHYSFGNDEMYGRKVALMQVLKYMPKSIELSTAMEVDLASNEGKGTDYINGEFVSFEVDTPAAKQIEHQESEPVPEMPINQQQQPEAVETTKPQQQTRRRATLE